MTRIFFGFFTAALIDLLNGAVILSFPYIAIVLNAGETGTEAHPFCRLGHICDRMFLNCFHKKYPCTSGISDYHCFGKCHVFSDSAVMVYRGYAEAATR